MIERYLDKFSDLLINYCIEAKENDEVLIVSTIEAKSLLKYLIRGLVEKGCYPILKLWDEELAEIFFRYAKENVLRHLSKIDFDLEEIPNAEINIISYSHTKYLAGIDPEKLKIRQETIRPLREIFNRRDEEGSLRWCVTIYPTKALAQDAGMSLEEYENFIIKALMLDKEDPIKEWKKFSEELNRIKEKLEKVKEIRIVHEDGTDLTLSVEGRKWIVDDGKNNMPGGEIFTAPVEETVEGVIYFLGIQNYKGMFDVEDIKLVIKNGEIIEATAKKGEEFLKKIINTDEGSKRIGELGIGMNYNIDRITKNILLDEKIGGTIHLAIGMAYKRCGGKNESSIHWDLIKDMRKGKIYADGELIYENGRFII